MAEYQLRCFARSGNAYRAAPMIVRGHNAIGNDVIAATANDLQCACLELFGGEIEELGGNPF
jgi:hypothetical protein